MKWGREVGKRGGRASSHFAAAFVTYPPVGVRVR